MSLLQDLVQEFQQRIEGQAAAPSTAAVADAAGSERINVTLPRGVMDDSSVMPSLKGAVAAIWPPICWKRPCVVIALWAEGLSGLRLPFQSSSRLAMAATFPCRCNLRMETSMGVRRGLSGLITKP